MKITVYIIISIMFFLYLGHIEITFKPFSIIMPAWRVSVGVLLIIIGFLFLHVDSYKDGLDKGAKIVEQVYRQKGLIK